jgi:chromosomal replication initiator protein
MARSAAMHVAGSPGHLYNPLFIYGGVGLGKTHLVHAVGNQLLKDKPDAKVLYIHAEQFVSDVVKAYQRRTFDEFKERYHSLDLLLIDDVQFFANKDRTQEEFFNAFEALLAKKSHIVMTSTPIPRAGQHPRAPGLALRLRPDGGHRAARAGNARGDPDQQGPRRERRHARGSRLLRGQERALQRARAGRRAAQDPGLLALQPEGSVDPAGARGAARPAVHPEPPDQVENIQKTVADYYKIKVADMYSKKRPASIARPRQIAMYLAKELTQRACPRSASCSAAATTPPCCTPCARLRASASN